MVFEDLKFLLFYFDEMIPLVYFELVFFHSQFLTCFNVHCFAFVRMFSDIFEFTPDASGGRQLTVNAPWAERQYPSHNELQEDTWGYCAMQVYYQFNVLKSTRNLKDGLHYAIKMELHCLNSWFWQANTLFWHKGNKLFSCVETDYILQRSRKPLLPEALKHS